MIDVALLQIDGAVFHTVPTRGMANAGSEPELSTVETSLDDQLEFFLRDRLTRTFNHAAQPVRRDPSAVSPTPAMVTSALAGGSPIDVVVPFNILPALLLDKQAYNSPKGLLAIIRGRCGPTNVLAIVKVEQERGLSFDTVTENGETRVVVMFEDGLVFTDKTEVFKAAIFYLAADGSLAGLITDDQSGSMYSGPASQYWLSAFLGCEYSNDEDVTTRAWVRANERLIKADLKDPTQKNAVYTAVQVELASNRVVVDPQQFIVEHIPPQFQDAALQRLRDEGAPTTRFRKSRAVANTAPNRKRIVFDNGFEVVMPVGVEPALTREIVGETEVDVLTIRGNIRRVGR